MNSNDLLKNIIIIQNKSPSPPPYHIDSRLRNNPCFKTTHITEYTNHSCHKYAKVKSKYLNNHKQS